MSKVDPLANRVESMVGKSKLRLRIVIVTISSYQLRVFLYHRVETKKGSTPWFDDEGFIHFLTSAGFENFFPILLDDSELVSLDISLSGDILGFLGGNFSSDFVLNN